MVTGGRAALPDCCAKTGSADMTPMLKAIILVEVRRFLPQPETRTPTLFEIVIIAPLHCTRLLIVAADVFHPETREGHLQAGELAQN